MIDERAHSLIDSIYDASVRREAWSDVLAGISDVFGGSPAMLGFLLPGEVTGVSQFAHKLRDDLVPHYVEHLLHGVPWSTKFMYRFVDRWGSMAEVMGDTLLEQSGLYTEWMKPQGLAPIWPVGFSLADADGTVLGGFTIFRAEGQGEFTDEECEEAGLFSRHITRAFRVHLELHGFERVNLALAEAMDRLPTGLVLLDARRKVVIQNRASERIFALDDGLGLDRSGVSAEDARENALLQNRIAEAMEATSGREFENTGFVAVTRPSGLRPFAVMVTPLLSKPGGTVSSEAVIAIFVTDPESFSPSSEVLEELYSLTHSEAELVRLLSTGISLEEAAKARGVSMNTARSHLKHVFSKTGTSRQGELLRLVITGLGSISED